MFSHQLKLVWAKWKVIAHKIGNFQTRLFLSIFYFIVFAPFALVIKLFSDPMRLRPGSARAWLHRVAAESDPLTQARRQF